MKILRYIFLVLYTALIVLIFCLAGSSAEKSTEESDTVTEVVIKTVDTITPGSTSITDKYSMEDIKAFVRKGIGHFGMFAALGFLGFITYYGFIKKRILRYILALLSGVVVAATSEVIQIFAENRGPGFADVALDYAGYLAGSILMFIIVLIVVLIKKKHGVVPYGKL